MRIAFIILAAMLALAAVSLVMVVSGRTGPESAFHVKTDENTVIFGVTPWGDARHVREVYNPLLQYLSEATGKKFQILAMENYDIAIDNIVEGNIDIAVASPVCYVKALAREPGLQYIATIVREDNGRRYAAYKGYMIALKSKYAGWTFNNFLKNPGRYGLGLVESGSASGYAYPMALMKKNGIDPKSDFKSFTIFENHNILTDALVSGKIDVGATWEYNLEDARKRYGNIFEIVYTTPNIPGLLWIASKNANPILVKQIYDILMEISASEELRNKLLKDTPDKGWMVMDKSYYDGVKEVVKYVGDLK